MLTVSRVTDSVRPAPKFGNFKSVSSQKTQTLADIGIIKPSSVSS